MTNQIKASQRHSKADMYAIQSLHDTACEQGAKCGEMKAGARHSKEDMMHFQAIHDSAKALGAMCDEMGSSSSVMSVKAPDVADDQDDDTDDDGVDLEELRDFIDWLIDEDDDEEGDEEESETKHPGHPDQSIHGGGRRLSLTPASADIPGADTRRKQEKMRSQLEKESKKRKLNSREKDALNKLQADRATNSKFKLFQVARLRETAAQLDKQPDTPDIRRLKKYVEQQRRDMGDATVKPKEKKPKKAKSKKDLDDFGAAGDALKFTPPENVQRAAALGLELRRKFGRGGTEVGVARARDLSNGRTLSEETIPRMVSYFARHEVDKQGEGWGDENNPSAGYIAWLLWGGDEGRAWAEAMNAKLQDETKSLDYAVKSLGDDRIGAYAVIFGSPERPDLSPYRDYFTKDTEFWLDKWQVRPVIYGHAMETATAADPVVGVWTKATMDDIGIWMEGELDKAHRYRKAIGEMVKRGILALSSDSAPHLVKREPSDNNTHKVTRWPLLAASLTPTPAEPRLLPVEQIKSAYKALGLTLDIDTPEQPIGDQDVEAKGATAQSAGTERARRLTIELDLISL